MSALLSSAAMRVGASTHIGKVREENQDRMSRFLCPLGEVFVVADGMGGHMGGAAAAAMVTRGFEEALAQVPPGSTVAAVLQSACSRLNEAMHREATSGNPATARMGSTVVLALIKGLRVTLAHAGDSRAYLFRKGRLDRLTRDHSRVQSLVDQGYITESEARDHPDSSVLNRCLGAKSEVMIEVSGPFELRKGDALMLCSDGLHGYLGKDAIGEAIARNPDPQNAAEALVQLALEAGGQDNTTVQVIQMGIRRATRYNPTPPIGGLNRSGWLLTVAGLILLLGIIFAAGLYLGRRFPPPLQAGTPKPELEKKEVGTPPIGTRAEPPRNGPETTEDRSAPFRSRGRLGNPRNAMTNPDPKAGGKAITVPDQAAPPPDTPPIITPGTTTLPNTVIKTVPTPISPASSPTPSIPPTLQ